MELAATKWPPQGYGLQRASANLESERPYHTPYKTYQPHNDKRNRPIPVVETDQTPLQDKLANLPLVKLKSVRNTSLEPLYNSLVQHHHYLGYRQIVGNHLKYIAFIGDQPVACLGWASAAPSEFPNRVNMVRQIAGCFYKLG